MKDLINRLESVGVAREKLRVVLEDDVFNDLSKHNPRWESEHEPEGELLHDLRFKLAWLEEQLWAISAALEPLEAF